MSPDPNYVQKTKERYAEWERSAHINFLVCISVVLITGFLYPQNILPVISCLVSGVAIFIAWRTFMNDQFNLALLFGIAGVILSFPPVILGDNLPISVILVQGIPLAMLSLFACILISRKKT